MLNEIDQNYKIIDYIYNESFIDDQRTFVPLQSTGTETKWEVEQMSQKQKNRQRENEKDVI